MDRLRNYGEAIIDRLADVVGRKSYLYSELHFAIMLVIWGAWVLYPNETFNSAQGFGTMEQFASPLAWGLIAVALGVSKIRFLLHGHKISLSVLTLISGWFWIFIGVSFFLSSPPNTGFVAYTALGLYEFWVYRAMVTKKQ